MPRIDPLHEGRVIALTRYVIFGCGVSFPGCLRLIIRENGFMSRQLTLRVSFRYAHAFLVKPNGTIAGGWFSDAVDLSHVSRRNAFRSIGFTGKQDWLGLRAFFGSETLQIEMWNAKQSRPSPPTRNCQSDGNGKFPGIQSALAVGSEMACKCGYGPVIPISELVGRLLVAKYNLRRVGRVTKIESFLCHRPVLRGPYLTSGDRSNGHSGAEIRPF